MGAIISLPLITVWLQVSSPAWPTNEISGLPASDHRTRTPLPLRIVTAKQLIAQKAGWVVSRFTEVPSTGWTLPKDSLCAKKRR
jgi:hypothetical protein